MSRTRHLDRDARRSERANRKRARVSVMAAADEKERAAERAAERHTAELERYRAAVFTHRNPENGDTITYSNSSPAVDALRRAIFRARIVEQIADGADWMDAAE